MYQSYNLIMSQPQNPTISQCYILQCPNPTTYNLTIQQNHNLKIFQSSNTSILQSFNLIMPQSYNLENDREDPAVLVYSEVEGDRETVPDPVLVVLWQGDAGTVHLPTQPSVRVIFHCTDTDPSLVHFLQKEDIDQLDISIISISIGVIGVKLFHKDFPQPLRENKTLQLESLLIVM